MASFTYLINMHAGLVFFVTVGFFAAVLFGAVSLMVWLNKKTTIPPGISKPLFFAILLLCLAAVFGVAILFKSAGDRGGIRELFIVPTADGPRLALWCTRLYGKKVGTDYEQYIHTFDLQTAALQGSVKIDGKFPSDDYRVYWPGGEHAWGYRKEVGLMQVDLVIPEVVADNRQLVKRNPILGNGFVFEAFKDLADPHKAGLYVKSANGQLYRIEEDLSAVLVNGVPDEATVERTGSIPKNWFLYPLKNSKGKHAHTRGVPCASEKSITLLAPQFIPEMNPAVSNTVQKRIWVTHQSALLGECDRLLSYVGEDGVAQSTINVSKLVPGDKLKILSTYTSGEKILIFVSTGGTFRSTILGFSLAGLQTDIDTGELLELLTYF